MGQRLTQATYIAKAKLIHKEKYDYSLVEYKTLYNSKIKIICIEHNQIFEQIPRNHFRYEGCPICSTSTKKTKEIFINQANKIHSNKYNYEAFEYINNKTKGIVSCKSCKTVWAVRPDNHLFNKNGCPTCSDKAIYTKAYYIANKIPNHECYLYLIEFSHEQERFLKVGITKHSNVSSRFRGQLKDYNLSLVFCLKMDFFKAYEKEQEILCKYIDARYLPIKVFKGRTECLNISCKDKVVQDFVKLLSP